MLRRQGLVGVVALAIVLIGCAVDRPLPTSTPAATVTTIVDHPYGSPRPPRLPMADVAMTPCRGTAWPPPGADADDAITANWYDSVIPNRWPDVQVTNHTSTRYSAVVESGVTPDEAAECVVRGASGCGAGPVPAGSTFEMGCLDVHAFTGVFIYAAGCGEICGQDPIGWIVLPRPVYGPVPTT